MNERALASSNRGKGFYFPAIVKAHLVKQFAMGAYRAILVRDCESVGPIYYEYALYVRKQDEASPLLCMVSEIAEIQPETGERFLCMFHRGTHYNMGSSSDWWDIEKFTAAAITRASWHLGITEQAVELPLDAESGFNLPLDARLC